MPSFHNTYRAATVSLDAVPGDGSIRVSALMELRVQPVTDGHKRKLLFMGMWSVLYRKKMMLGKLS